MGVAPVGGSEARVAVEYRIDAELGCAILSDIRDLAGDATAPQQTRGPGGKGEGPVPPTMELQAEVAASAAEVLASHLSNYLSSKDQKNKVSAANPDFISFIGQSIEGTDPLVVDTALHAQLMGVDGKRNAAKTNGKSGTDNWFSAVGINDALPAISCNLEVVVLYPGGAHIAHRGRSRQYLLNRNGMEQLTQDYVTGRLLDSQDGMGDFMPKVELRSVKMEGKDRLVIISQGCFPRNQEVNLEQPIGKQDSSPQQHAVEIARRIAKHKTASGYVIVIDGMRKEPTATFSLKNLGKLGNSQPSARPPPKVGPPKVRRGSIRSPSDPLTRRRDHSASLKDLENSKLFTPDELTDLRGRMKGRFESELGAFEEEMYEILAAKIAAMEKRLAKKFADVESTMEEETAFPVMSMPPPLPTGDPEDGGWNLEGRLSYEPSSDEESTIYQKPADPMTEPVESAVPTKVPVSRRVKTALDSLRVLTNRALAGIRALGLRKKARDIGDRLALIQIKERHPFARRWVAPTGIATLLLLAVFLSLLLGWEDEDLSGALPSPAESAAEEPNPSATRESTIQPPAQIDRVAKSETGDSKSTVSKDADSEDIEYLLGRPETRKQAYARGRLLYLKGDSGRDESGSRLTRGARIRNLLGALPYLERAREEDSKLGFSDPDISFLKARTHYVLAKLGHDRIKHSESALEAFRQHRKLSAHLSKKKKKTIKRNISRLKRWLR
ncbi:MAG: hypothetical protein GY854_29190 [Deltaproteobacteria bacterium]|nr:hypothetical protein [Deltaproteobacteria bacterium]